MRSVLFLAASAAFLPLSAEAQDAPAVSEAVVTASRLDLALTPYPTQVIGAGRLAGAEGLADALSDIADLYIQAPGGRAGFGSLFLRGADPNFTAVMFEGVPLNNPTNTRGGAVNISEIGSAGVDRVEIVAGPLSGLYGSGGLAGAVNLLAPGGTAAPEGRISLGGGTRGDYSAAAGVRGPLGAGYGGSLSADLVDAGDMPGGAHFEAQTVSGKIAGLDGADTGRIVFRVMRSEAETFPDNSGGPLYATLRDLERRTAREALIGASQPFVVSDAVRLDFSASLLARRDRTDSPGVAPSDFDPMGVPEGSDLSRYRRATAQAAARVQRGVWQAAFGGEIQQERARSSGELVFFGFPMPTDFAGDRRTLSAFAEAARSGGGWTLDGGLRMDSVQHLGEHVTGRVGLAYAIPNTGFAVRAAAGTAFKAPSFYALGNPFVGNPALGPERSRAAELGLSWTGNSSTFAATAFHTRYRGLIDFQTDPFPQLVNRKAVVSRGISASAAHRWNARLISRWQGLYADTHDAETGERLLNRPKWRTSSSLAWTPVERLTLTVRQSYVGARNDYATPTGPRRLGAYYALGGEAAWTVRPQTLLRVVVDNALDDDHEDAIGFRTPGARARLLLSQGF